MYPILKGEKLQLTPILILVHLESLSRFTISFVVYQKKKRFTISFVQVFINPSR